MIKEKKVTESNSETGQADRNQQGVKYQIWNIIVRLLGIAVTAGISYYFGTRDSKEIDPTFIVEGKPAKIISTQDVYARIKLFREFDDKPISGNVYAQKFYFFNQGNGVIKEEDVLSPIKVVLTDTTAEIVDFSLIKRSREVTLASVVFASTSPRELLIPFKILEKNDGLCAQVIYASTNPSPLKIEGAIEGSPQGFSSQLKSKYFGISKASIISSLPVIFFGLLLLLSIIPLFIINRHSIGSEGFITWFTSPYELIVVNPNNRAQKTSFMFSYWKILLTCVIVFFIIFILSIFLVETALRKGLDKIRVNEQAIEVPETLEYNISHP